MIRASVALLLAAAAFAGCAQTPALTNIVPAVTVSCADRPYGHMDGRAGESDYGCATARNLAAMAADPQDLEGGRTAGPSKGDAALLAVERHRKGQDKPLPPVVGGASAGGGPPEQTRPP